VLCCNTVHRTSVLVQCTVLQHCALHYNCTAHCALHCIEHSVLCCTATLHCVALQRRSATLCTVHCALQHSARDATARHGVATEKQEQTAYPCQTPKVTNSMFEFQERSRNTEYSTTGNYEPEIYDQTHQTLSI